MILKLIKLNFVNLFVSTQELSVTSIDPLKNIVTIKKDKPVNTVRFNNLQRTTIAESSKIIFNVRSL